MDLFEKLIAQLAVVQTVWLPFLLAVAIIAAIVWRAVDYAYSTRLTNAASTKELLERQLQEYRDKLSGATPDEAKARLDALEARLDGLRPRRLSADQRQRMIPLLDPLRGASIDIASDAAAADAAQISRGLVAAFNGAGWNVRTPMVMGLGNPPLTGIGLAVRDLANLTPAENAVMDALKAAELEFDLQIGPDPFPDQEQRVNLTLSHRLEE